MEKRELRRSFRVLRDLNKKAFSKNATNDDVKRLNYYIIELGHAGVKFNDFCKYIAGKVITQDEFNLLCRSYEQLASPTLIYDPSISYNGNMKAVKPTVSSEELVKNSNWYKYIHKYFDGIMSISKLEEYEKMGESEIIRFSQCYMLIEQVGRERSVAEKVKEYLSKEKSPIALTKVRVVSYHHRELEVVTRINKIANIVYGDMAFRKELVNISNKPICENVEEFKHVRRALAIINKGFLPLCNYFALRGDNNTIGDTTVYSFRNHQFGVTLESPGLKAVMEESSRALGVLDVARAADELILTSELYANANQVYDDSKEYFKEEVREEEVEEVREEVREEVVEEVVDTDGDASDILGAL